MYYNAGTCASIKYVKIKGNAGKMDKKITIRIPDFTIELIEKYANSLNISNNDVYKFAIAEFIEKHNIAN